MARRRRGAGTHAQRPRSSTGGADEVTAHGIDRAAPVCEWLTRLPLWRAAKLRGGQRRGRPRVAHGRPSEVGYGGRSGGRGGDGRGRRDPSPGGGVGGTRPRRCSAQRSGAGNDHLGRRDGADGRRRRVGRGGGRRHEPPPRVEGQARFWGRPLQPRRRAATAGARWARRWLTGPSPSRPRLIGVTTAAVPRAAAVAAAGRRRSGGRDDLPRAQRRGGSGVRPRQRSRVGRADGAGREGIWVHHHSRVRAVNRREGEKTSSRSSLSQTPHSTDFQPRFPASRPRSVRFYLCHLSGTGKHPAATVREHVLYWRSLEGACAILSISSFR